MRARTDTPMIGSTAAIECIDVGKRFYHFEQRASTLQEFFTRLVLRKPVATQAARFQLEGVNLRIEKGESVALIGPNGSGKSTILRLIAGIYPPTEGTVVRSGRMVAVIELGATFQPSLTGDENVTLYAAALGYSRREIQRHLEPIFEFAGLGDFRDVPLKYYSSGMRSRLAFAIASSARPDILLLDEILAVGDHEFRARCTERLRAFQASGGTLLFVTHDLDAMREMCTRAIWIDQGRVRAVGSAREIGDRYWVEVLKPQQAAGVAVRA